MQKEYLSAAAEVLSDQGVDENLGLSNDEASSRLAKTGPNKLEEAEKTPLWKRFFEQMADPMVIMLIVAAVISALTGLVKGEPDFADVAIIMFVVIVNSVLGVVQEAKSEEALEALQEMSAAQSKVLRDGKLVGEYKIAELPRVQLVSKMLGKELDDLSEIKSDSAAEIAARVVSQCVVMRLSPPGSQPRLNVAVRIGTVTRSDRCSCPSA